MLGRIVLGTDEDEETGKNLNCQKHGRHTTCCIQKR